MVGLLVTPTTCLSSTRACRLPVRRRSRLMSSSQMDTPRSDSWASGSLMSISPSVSGGRAANPAGPFQRRVRRGDDPVGGEAELLEQHVALGARAEMVDRHDLTRVADDL